MNIREALETAIQFEKQIRDAYVEARDRAESREQKQWFHAFAKTEHEHYKYLTDSLQLWKQTGQLKLDYLSVKLDADLIEEEVKKAKLELKGGQFEGMNLIEMLKKIYQFEKKTFDFYLRVSMDLSLSDRKFFDRFVESEKGHLQNVQERIELLEENDQGH